MTVIELEVPRRKKAQPRGDASHPPLDPPDKVIIEMEPDEKIYLRVEPLEEPSSPLIPPDEPPPLHNPEISERPPQLPGF